MSKMNEIDYFKNIGNDAIEHVRNKPYLDPKCGSYLIDIGMLFELLPQPPARILDLGAGTGWTTIFLARRGYDVTGQDISDQGIVIAEENKAKAGLKNVNFIVSDYESLDFHDEFDVAVFYDCLHHSEDTAAALKSAYKSLKPGGICITFEPGTGHHKSEEAVTAIRNWGVTEKDMPPKLIIKIGRKIGFKKFKVYLRIQKSILTFRYSSIKSLFTAIKIFLRWLPPFGNRKTNIVVLTK